MNENPIHTFWKFGPVATHRHSLLVFSLPRQPCSLVRLPSQLSFLGLAQRRGLTKVFSSWVFKWLCWSWKDEILCRCWVMLVAYAWVCFNLQSKCSSKLFFFFKWPGSSRGRRRRDVCRYIDWKIFFYFILFYYIFWGRWDDGFMIAAL